MSQSDIELFLEFKEHKAIKAFEELVNRYRKAMVNFFYHFIWDETMSDDLAQEVFIKLALSAKTYTPQAKFNTFLYRIAQNLLIDHLRKKSIMPHQVSLEKKVGDDKEECLKDIIASRADSPVDELVNDEKEVVLRNVIKKLPEEQRMVVELSVFRELDYAEIAEIMDVPVNTIKSRMRLALIHLKELMSLVL